MSANPTGHDGLATVFSSYTTIDSYRSLDGTRAASDVSSAADRKTISLPISASRLRKHATRLSSASGRDVGRKSRTRRCAFLASSKVRATTAIPDDIKPLDQT
jgi:hypothetical protein